MTRFTPETELIFNRKDVDDLVRGLKAQIAALEARIVELEAALSAPRKASRNSGSRPSSDYKPNKL